MLENVRFHKEEEANDPGFAKQLAALGQVYVNDASARRTGRTPPPRAGPPAARRGRLAH